VYDVVLLRNEKVAVLISDTSGAQFLNISDLRNPFLFTTYRRSAGIELFLAEIIPMQEILMLE
jgi:hypothetical protein